LTNAVVQVLSNGISVNSPTASASAFYGYFLSLDEKKCFVYDNTSSYDGADDDNSPMCYLLQILSSNFQATQIFNKTGN
jgi:hypothetical protein